MQQKIQETSAQSGYTLPVFACAAALAGLRHLVQKETKNTSLSSVQVDLLVPAQVVDIPVEQVACLTTAAALAITRSDPGDNLDITRHTPVWALVEWRTLLPEQPRILLQGGEGLGYDQTTGVAAIYNYAQRLLLENLQPWLPDDRALQVTIILPQGRQLAERTSNAAFGIVAGLSLLGTSGIAQPLSAPDQLDAFQADLQRKARQFQHLVFCVGENGLDLVRQLGINPEQVIKTANWLGPLLAAAGVERVQSILLFGYHGKLIKLAGGIFHTHHHVADARQEIFTAHCANLGLPPSDLQTIFASPTTEAALQYLQTLDSNQGSDWVQQVYGAIATQIDQRTQAYIQTHSEHSTQVGSVLFGRDRQIIIKSSTGEKLLSQLIPA